MGILAANYGSTSGATWSQGDFNRDGKIDVGDLGILAANYGADAGGGFNADGTADRDIGSSACGNLGFLLIAGVFLAGVDQKVNVMQDKTHYHGNDRMTMAPLRHKE